MNFKALDQIFWVLGFVGHLFLLFVLLIRRRWLRFPVFTTMFASQVIITVVLFLVSRYGTSHTYFVAYWLCATADFTLQVALMIEVASSICRMNGVWLQTAKRGLWTWVAAGVIIAAGTCFAIRPPSMSVLDLWDLRGTLFTSLLTCMLVLGVSMTANRLHLQRSGHVMALAQGLALWTAIAVAGDALKVATGWRYELTIFDQTRSCIYLFDLVFWTISFWRPGKVPALSFASIDFNNAVLQSTCASLANPRVTAGDL